MKNKILMVVSILFALMFINAGLNKIFHYIPMSKDMPEAMMTMFGAMTTIGWLLPLVAIVEIVGGILVICKGTRALGAVMLFPIMIGILCTHFVADPKGLLMPLVFFAIEIWILIENKNKYLPMVCKDCCGKNEKCCEK